MASFFDTKIEYLKGVGPHKAELLNKELNIFTFGDLIQHYPFRYEDRTKFHSIQSIHSDQPYVQVKGVLRHVEKAGSGRRMRLVAYVGDGSGELELIWFKGIQWVVKKLKIGVEYVVFGKPSVYNGRINMAHPEIEVVTPENIKSGFLQPVYSTTEKLKSKFLDSRAIFKLQKTLINAAKPHIRETLPQYLTNEYKLIPKQEAVIQIHIPDDQKKLAAAVYRLKFEEFFYIQLRLLKMKIARMDKFKGQVFNNSSLLTEFYNKHLPFELTGAQKRVIKEIYRDLKSGHQMNRLIQGDVGSGKTIVSFICMLIVIGSGAQVAMMAPTEILADQHYKGLKPFADELGIEMAILKGATKKNERTQIHEKLENGELNIIVGTHALLEDKVKFSNLGLAVTDEQHRFGVAQRAKLWQKTEGVYPHILVMTATPIPRTLAMTLYGDLDVSIIDELPAGRKPVETQHKYDTHRLQVFGFMKKQIELGRQVYVVYPLIEESENLDLKHLKDGYEAIRRAFPDYQVSIVHGKMKPENKDYEMQQFVSGKAKILVATTVIEVGVDVPNASVMVIENAERFGLAQLHQLRGRVGRGAEQSYCILMTDFKLSKEARHRINTMVRTSDGFEIAEADLKLRGPGNLMGTQQSGMMDLLIADLGKDGPILQAARTAAKAIMKTDPELKQSENQVISRQINATKKNVVNWSRIS